MSRIVMVSNRVTDLSTAAKAGGVSVALAEIVRTQASLWFGWSGEVLEIDAAGEEKSSVKQDVVGQSALATIKLGAMEFRDYYLGYSNSVLWPVFHNRLDLAQFEAGYYLEYKNVNKRFASLLSTQLRAGDIIWIHDYHLIPLAAELRALGVTNPIGFFLHIPVPPSQAFLAIPEHLELANALSAYDLIGLQTKQDVANLIDFFHQSIFGRLLPDGRMRVAERMVRIASFPVGIDVQSFENDSYGTPCDATEFRIVGVDRLDYTKGLPHKFRAFGKFLKENPEYRRRVVLSQIAPPTRETLEAYSDIRTELEALAGSINGHYSELDWVPIYYMHRAVDRGDLYGIYRSSRVGLVTPLRDGMNLVAKEYVAAQNPDDPGVLILSRFAGAAEQMDAALIINPYNIAETAGAIRAALEMPLDERRQRHGVLVKTIRQHDSSSWSRSFLTQLTEAAGANLPPTCEDTPLSGVLQNFERNFGGTSIQ